MKIKFFRVILALAAVLHTHFTPLVYACAGTQDYFDRPTFLEHGYFDALLALFLPEDDARDDEESLSYTDYLAALSQLCAPKGIPPFQDETLPKVSYAGDLPSNNYQNALKLIKAALVDLNNKDDLIKLVHIRHKILCLFQDQELQTSLPQEIASLPEHLGLYKIYLEAAYYFYKGDYDKAASLFSKIHGSLQNPSLVKRAMTVLGLHPQQKWLEEATLYLEGRSYLLEAQKIMSGYDTKEERREKVTRPLLEKGFETLKHYQKKHPHGAYAQSAHNLERRYFFLASRQEDLDRRLITDLSHALSSKNGRRIQDLFQEFRHYFQGKIDPHTAHPLLVACVLQTTTLSQEEETAFLKALTAREKDFKAFPHLHLFLMARTLFDLKKYDDLLSLKAPLPNGLEDLLPLTTYSLKIKAALAVNKPQDALDLLKSLAPIWQDDTSDLLHLQAHLLKKSSPQALLLSLSQEKVQTLYLHHLISFDDLELLSKHQDLPKDLTAFVKEALMKRLLLSASHEKALALNDIFKTDAKPFIPDEEADAMKTLLTDPTNTTALVRVGKWVMEHVPYLESYEFSYELKSFCPTCTVLTQEELMPEKNLVTPFDYFLKTISIFEATRTKSPLEAEALYYLTAVCFHGSDDARHCLWRSPYNLPPSIEELHKNKVPKWFAKLHRLYPETEWAKKARYYY